ncbi:hypothetical protein RYX36_020672 [Vicia faba]
MYEGSLDLLPSPYSELDSVSKNVSASKVLDNNVNLLHNSNKPYMPPCRNKALSSSSGDSNGSLKSDISGSSECTDQEVQPELEKHRNVSPTKFPRIGQLWESCVYLEPPLVHAVQIQQDLKLKSSNTSFEDCSSYISGFNFPDEDDLDSPQDSTFEMIKNLIEFVLDGDDYYDDNYYSSDKGAPDLDSPCGKNFHSDDELRRLGLGENKSNA